MFQQVGLPQFFEMKSSLMRTQPPTVNDAESSMIAVMLIFKFIYNQFMMLDDDYFSQMRVRVVTSNQIQIRVQAHAC